MYFFGYVQNDADPESITPFFTYEHSSEDLANYNGFRRHNE